MFTSFKQSGEQVGGASVFLCSHFFPTNISASGVSESEVLEA